MTDDEGVLGNLPNSRPGRRSAKRSSVRSPKRERPAKAAEKAAVKAEASGKQAARPARASTPRRQRDRTTAVKGAGSGDRGGLLHDMDAKRGHDSASARETSGDPLTAAVRGAAGLAATGVKVAGAVTQELLRRLPRP